MKSTLSILAHTIGVIALIILPWESQANIVVMQDVTTPYNYTTTTRIENFIMQNTRQYNAVCHKMEIYLEEFRRGYIERIELLEMNQEFLQIQLGDVQQYLNPLELLDDVHNYCVNRYGKKLPDIDKIKKNLSNCLTRAYAVYDSVILPASSTHKNLKTHYSTQYQTMLDECGKKFNATEEANLTNCVTNTVRNINQYTTSNMNVFHNQLKQAYFQATIKMKEAFDCHSAIVYQTLTRIGSVVGLVERCSTGNEYCPRCIADDKGNCPYLMNLYLSDQDLASDKITNPFRSISRATTCLQINFSKRNLTNP